MTVSTRRRTACTAVAVGLGAAVTLGTLAGSASAAPAAASRTPTTILTLTGGLIHGLPASFAPGYHTFVVYQKVTGRELDVIQPKQGYSAKTLLADEADSFPATDSPAAVAKAEKAFARLTGNATFVGGIATPSPSESSTFTVKLAPGLATFVNSPLASGRSYPFTVPVTGGASVGSAPAVAGSITTHEFGFLFDKIKPGKRKYAIHNGGSELHFVEIEYLDPGHTDAEVTKALQSDGPPPSYLHDAGLFDVLSPGQTQYVTFDFKKGGHYLVLCFMPDPTTGMTPHAFLGMSKFLHL